MTPSGAESVIYRFKGEPDGSMPYSSLTDINGEFYGTTGYGGAKLGGTVFKIDSSGHESVLYSLPRNSIPQGGPLYDNGALYGTTTNDGTANHGTVFKVTLDGKGTIEAISNESSLVTASPPLGVTFSQPVTVRHAWVLAALTKGEEVLGWDKHGTVPCDVPEFESTSINLANPRSVVSPSPLPSPQGPMPIAVADSPPFAIEKCETPFVEAKRTVIVWPRDVTGFPDVSHGPYVPAIVFIALDGNGRVLDAWLRESTGYAPEDLAALRSARMSTYSGAISYCRHVPGVEADIWTF